MDGPGSYAEFGGEQRFHETHLESQNIRWYTTTKELSNFVDGANKVESLWNTDNVSRNVLFF